MIIQLLVISSVFILTVESYYGIDSRRGNVEKEEELLLNDLDNILKDKERRRVSPERFYDQLPDENDSEYYEEIEDNDDIDDGDIDDDIDDEIDDNYFRDRDRRDEIQGRLTRDPFVGEDSIANLEALRNNYDFKNPAEWRQDEDLKEIGKSDEQIQHQEKENPTAEETPQLKSMYTKKELVKDKPVKMEALKERHEEINLSTKPSKAATKHSQGETNRKHLHDSNIKSIKNKGIILTDASKEKKTKQFDSHPKRKSQRRSWNGYRRNAAKYVRRYMRWRFVQRKPCRRVCVAVRRTRRNKHICYCLHRRL